MASGGETFHFENVRQTGEATTWQASLTILPDLPFLSGHFPGMPIVPAVALLEASHALVALVGGPTAQQVVSARHCKFRQPIGPGETYVLHATTEREGVWHVTWTASKGESANDGDSPDPIVEVGLSTRGPG